MESGEGGEEVNTEYRVSVTSKKEVTAQINRYKELLERVLHRQPPEALPDALKTLTQELLANFEAAVQTNVLVNGLCWDEAPDDEVEEEASDLGDLLDDALVETTRRRSRYPKHILPHVVHSLKAERKIMGLYEKVVKGEEVTRDPVGEAVMCELSAAAPVVVREAIQAIKSINTLQRQAEGLCQVLHMKPSSASLEIHREVFGPSDQSTSLATGRMKRATDVSAATEGYEPCAKKAECTLGNDKVTSFSSNVSA